MKKRLMSLLLAAALLLSLTPAALAAEAAEDRDPATQSTAEEAEEVTALVLKDEEGNSYPDWGQARIITLHENDTAKPTIQLTLETEPAAAQPEITWKSWNENAATVDETGLITIQGIGFACIDAIAAKADGTKVETSYRVAAVPETAPVISVYHDGEAVASSAMEERPVLHVKKSEDYIISIKNAADPASFTWMGKECVYEVLLDTPTYEDLDVGNFSIYPDWDHWEDQNYIIELTDGAKVGDTFTGRAYIDGMEESGAFFTVEVVSDDYVEPEEPGNYISSFWLGTSKGEALTTDESGAYNVAAPDYVSALNAWAELSGDAPEGAWVQLVYTNPNTGKEVYKTVPTNGKSVYCTALMSFGMAGAAAELQVMGDGTGVLQSYPVNISRVPTVKSLSLAEASFDESFAAATLAYTATTLADTVTVNAEAYQSDYTVTYNGGESNVIALDSGENAIEVTVTASGVSQTYTITVTKTGVVRAAFELAPEDAVVNLVDKDGVRILPGADGAYELMAGVDYTCTVTLAGYVGQKSTLNIAEDTTVQVTLEKAADGTTDPTIPAEWPNFRNGGNHLGITEAKTPYAPEDAELLWAVKYGTGWAAAPGSPILVDDCIVTYSGSTIRKLNKDTGAVVAEGTMVTSSSYSIVPATYAEGMIFIGLSGGRIQCFDAKTLQSLWVYTDPLGGQPNCPITYQNGYVYTGFWNGEDKMGNFVCLSATDEDPAQTTEAKLATWTYARKGGFYWAGAYASENGKYVLVGTDDGASGYSTESASLLVFESVSGKLVDSWDGIRGDIRSNVSHDPDSDRVFFTSKGGVLCSARIDWETGEISDRHTTVIVNSRGTAYAMSTCTPSVYNGRVYIGVAGNSQFTPSSGHCIAVYALEDSGEMTQAYVYDIVGYPQTSAMVSVGYVTDEDDSVYIYLPYNYTPGGISVLKDKPGQTAPVTTTGEGYSEVFTPSSPLAQYCICSTIADSTGTIYYKNDSCYMMAISSRLMSLEVSEDFDFTADDSGTVTVTGGSAWVNLKNGLTRDVSAYLTYDRTEGELVYTYGFDNANYGLKELRLKACLDHATTEKTYETTAKMLGKKHLVTEICADCGEVLQEKVWEDCFDTDLDGLCDGCGAKMVSAAPKVTVGDGFTGIAVRYDAGQTAEELTVSAASTYTSGTLTYQWYYSEIENDYADAVAIEGAESSAYTPSTAEKTAMRFYFCRVTLTIGENEWVRDSAQQPVIVCPLPTVTSYFSLTDDGWFVTGDGNNGGSGEVLALQKVTVPYFDLSLYGLEGYYFQSESYGPVDPDNPGQGSVLEPGTSAYAFGQITDLHLMIYMLEVHYCGVDPQDAGKGYLYDEGLMGTSVLNISGSTGSFFMQEVWGHDLNLNYYHNFVYPLASGGWGSTMDQILLHDGDIFTMMMYTSYAFYSDPKAGFNHFGVNGNPILAVTEAAANEQSLELTLYRSYGFGGDYTTSHNIVTDGVDVYYMEQSELADGEVSSWRSAGTTDENGKITINVEQLGLEAGKTYIFAVPGQMGEENPDDYVSCAGGILVTVKEAEALRYGDVNGDGTLDQKDVMLLQRYAAKLIGADQLRLELADLNGDGAVDQKDVMLLQMRVANLLSSFPVER